MTSATLLFAVTNAVKSFIGTSGPFIAGTHYAGSMATISNPMEGDMNNIIYIVGLIVVVVAVLSFFGLR